MAANRRRHRVFFTRHTEYHLRGDECVGVRERSTGEWLADHAALRLHALQLPAVLDSASWVGRRIHFWGSATDVLTSPVVSVGRPERDEVYAYVSQARAGSIARASVDLEEHEPPRVGLDGCLPAL
ncbi:hypothetical protein PPSIR1_37494 [Plesiocystis pacifica SIR-1]|uniref:Uncharacterized protein n=1 Tax=Plesiocystis pacifica SIR-1 TaxID=391625 RepID=A6GB24_9BACT|nr:hypothetical protein [Plesiocystis pacifica]EDM76906.1 hypothetical protein PPSIR1_37494 [Plesiocystis pacifica SIR-1]